MNTPNIPRLCARTQKADKNITWRIKTADLSRNNFTTTSFIASLCNRRYTFIKMKELDKNSEVPFPPFLFINILKPFK